MLCNPSGKSLSENIMGIIKILQAHEYVTLQVKAGRAAERANSRLKEDFGWRTVKVRGAKKVTLPLADIERFSKSAS